MKDIKGELTYKGQQYGLVFNFNTMEAIQDRYGTIEKWADLSDGNGSEPNAKAVIFGITAMINEWIAIQNEDENANIQPLTTRKVGRMISEIGFENAVGMMNDTVIKSTESAEKNA